MESRKRSYRRNPYRIMRQRLSALMAFVLTVSIVLGNGGFSPDIALAGQEHAEEEFRLHVEDIRTAALEALEAGEALDEPLEIGGDSEQLVERYQKFLEPDGTLYEIFPDYITTSNIEEMELRVFLRADRPADDTDYQLTGDEELIFLYVNNGNKPVDARLNIDGYVTESNTVNAYQAVFGDQEADKATDSNAAPAPAESEAPAAPAPEIPEEEPEESEVKNPETLAPEVKDPETPAPEVNAPEASAPEVKDPEASAPEVNDPTTDAKDPAPEVKDPEAPTTEVKDPADQEAEVKDPTPEATNPETEVKDPTENTIEINIPQQDSQDQDSQQQEPVQASEVIVDLDSAKESRIGVSRNQVYTVATMMATSSNTDSPAADNGETEDDELPDEIELINDLEDPIFEKKGRLKGKPYNLISLDGCATARAFVTSVANLEKCEPELEEGMHAIDYSITVGEEVELELTEEANAELVHAPEQAADGTRVTFGIIPKEGFEVAMVTANGDELALAEEEDLASPSNADEDTATPSDAELNVEGAVYYTIPEVFEEQWVEIELAKVEPVEPEFPAFEKAVEVGTGDDKVIVTVSADENILDPDTDVVVEEVGADVKEAVKAKVNAKNAEKPEEEQKTVTSVLAYDIKLTKNGEKLDDTWDDNGQVTVSLKGNPIEELGKEAEVIQTASIETADAAQEEAAEETAIMSLSLDADTDVAQIADSIEVNTDEQKTIEVEPETTVGPVMFAMRSAAMVPMVYGRKTNISELDLEDNADEPLITVSKKFSGISQEDIASLNSNGFQITVADKILTLNNATSKSADGLTYNWDVVGVKAGVHGVNELNQFLPSQYDVVTYCNDIKIDNITAFFPYELETVAAQMIFKNELDEQDCASITRPYPGLEFIAVMMTAKTAPDRISKGCFIWTKEPLSESERKAISQFVIQNGQGDFQQASLERCWFFSEDDIQEEQSFRGGTIKYDSITGDLKFTGKNLWTKIMAGSYEYVGEKKADVVIENIYTPKTTELKVVKHLLGDQTADVSNVEFELWKDTDGNGLQDQTIDELVAKKSAIDANIENTNINNVGEAKFADLVPGKYLLIETKTASGYKLLTEPILIEIRTITNDEGVASIECRKFSTWNDNWENGELINKEIGLTINNELIQIVLPETGGPGDFLLKRFGWMLMLLAMMGLEVETLNRRKRKAEK